MLNSVSYQERKKGPRTILRSSSGEDMIPGCLQNAVTSRETTSFRHQSCRRRISVPDMVKSNRLCRSGPAAVIRCAVTGRRERYAQTPSLCDDRLTKLTYQCFRLHRYSLGFGTRQSGSVKRSYYCAAHVDARICSCLFHIVSHKSGPQAPASSLRTSFIAQGRGIFKAACETIDTTLGSYQEWKNTRHSPPNRQFPCRKNLQTTIVASKRVA
jgi:hypothetical protein